MNWLYYCCALLVFSVVVMIVISNFTEGKTEDELAGLTHHSVSAEQAQEVRESWTTWDVVNTAIIVGIIGLCYYMFF